MLTRGASRPVVAALQRLGMAGASDGAVGGAIVDGYLQLLESSASTDI